MPKICVKAPEIVMSGDININTSMAVSTKAKLESVSVGGDCACGEAPPPPPRVPTPPPVVTQKTNVEVVFLVDGSDSFDRTKIEGAGVTEMGGVKRGSSQFNECMKWCGEMLWDKIVPNTDAGVVATVVQFSGIKALENSYKEDNDGWALDESVGLKHYNVELQPQQVNANNNQTDKLFGANPLDGNSQLFLALRDMSNTTFVNKLNNATYAPDVKNVIWQKRRVLVVITDDEWDINNERASLSESALDASLNQSVGATAREDVIRQVKSIYGSEGGAMNQMFAVIVTPSATKTERREKIVGELCDGVDSHMYDLTESNFDSGMTAALDKIAAQILKDTNSTVL